MLEPAVIDGKDDGAVWVTAQVIDGFRTFDPVENGDPTGLLRVAERI